MVRTTAASRSLFGLVIACGGGRERRVRDDAAPVAPPVIAVVDAAPRVAPSPRADEVFVDGFYIDRDEAVAGDYRACVTAGACTPSGRLAETKDPKVAMGGVTLAQARAYCRWKGKRLPTVAEWRRAALGDPPRTFPWGNDPATCERAWLKDCGKDEPQPPGRPSGASPYGARDMIGNVEEWTEPGEIDFATSCVAAPTPDAKVMGPSFFFGPGDTKGVNESDAAKYFDNRDTGMRCARSMVERPPPAPDPIIGALIAGGAWLAVERETSAAAAMTAAASRCGKHEAATVMPGDLVGGTGWLVIRSVHADESAARAAGSEAVQAPARPLVRVVGLAKCQGAFGAGPLRVTVRAGKRRYRFEPPESGIYELWLEAGGTAKLEIACPPTSCKDPCAAGRTGGDPISIVLSPTGSSGIEAAPLDVSAGCVCD